MKKKKHRIKHLSVWLWFFVSMNLWILSRIQNSGRPPAVEFRFLQDNSSTLAIREELVRLGKVRKPQKTIYARLLAKAAHALAEGQKKSEPKDSWAEPYFIASTWKPCADHRDWELSEGRNGYIMVTANGGINQQRVAVRSAILSLLQDYLMQHWFFRNFCIVVFGKMSGGAFHRLPET